MPVTHTWEGGREMEVAGREETNPLFFAIPAIIPLPGQGALHTRVHPLELRFPNRRKRNQITQTTSNDTHAQTKSKTIHSQTESNHTDQIKQTWCGGREIEAARREEPDQRPVDVRVDPFELPPVKVHVAAGHSPCIHTQTLVGQRHGRMKWSFAVATPGD